MIRLVPQAFVAGLVAACLVGCSEEAATRVNVEGDSKEIADLVESFNEATGNVKQAGPLFVKGASPKKDELKKYNKFAYFTTGAAAATGDAATMELTVRDESVSPAVESRVEWTFKKEGGQWKIASAPLP